MRHGSNSRRGRGGRGNSNRGNNRGGNSKTHTYDSNGPDVRIRGNAFQITEKYMTLARDATSAGDSTLAESYYQHAEHYQRIINSFAGDTKNQNQNSNKSSQSKDVDKKQNDTKGDVKGADKTDGKNTDKGAGPQPRVGGKSTKAKTEDVKADKAEAAPKKKKVAVEKKTETVDA